MNERLFEKELTKKCFGYGAGGLYFKEHYQEAKQNKITLKELVSNLQSDLNLDKEYGYDFDQELLNFPVSTQQEQLDFFEIYLNNSFTSFPELIGSIIGSLSSTQDFQVAYDFMGLDNIEDEIAWDS